MPFLKPTTLFSTLLICACVLPLHAQEQPSINFVARLRSSDPALLTEIGFPRLTTTEAEHLNDLLNAVYQIGHDEGVQSALASRSIEKNRLIAYQSAVQTAQGDILALQNGAILRLADTLGYVAYNKDAVLYGSGTHCQVWVEDRKTFPCTVIQLPTSGTKRAGREAAVRAIQREGAILQMDNGSVYEVNPLDQFTTSLWPTFTRVLILDDTEMVALDTGTRSVRVTHLQ